MKKKALVLLSMLILIATTGTAFSKSSVSTELADCIKLYKAQNFTECYARLTSYLKEDQANALAYYYMAMTATQIGRKDEAIDNYSKAISLAPNNSNLLAYAKKGKRCLEEPEACEEVFYETPVEEFIKKTKNSRISDEVNSQMERLKLEEIQRKMNRFEDIDKETFDEYRDFSSMNDLKSPTNDEIVAALRTLQKAGLGSFNNMNYSGLPINGQNNQDTILNMMGNSSISPQLIQAMLSNNMSLGF